jgi:hypothetical protein
MTTASKPEGGGKITSTDIATNVKIVGCESRAPENEAVANRRRGRRFEWSDWFGVLRRCTAVNSANANGVA